MCVLCGRSEEQLNTVFASAFPGDPARNDIGAFTQSLQPQSAAASCLLVLLSVIVFSHVDIFQLQDLVMQISQPSLCYR